MKTVAKGCVTGDASGPSPSVRLKMCTWLRFALPSGAHHTMNVCMENIPTLFNKSIDELRRIGARGGRAHGRNCRARRLTAMQAEPVLVAPPVAPAEESTAQAIATLDKKFPWLRAADSPASSDRLADSLVLCVFSFEFVL